MAPRVLMALTRRALFSLANPAKTGHSLLVPLNLLPLFSSVRGSNVLGGARVVRTVDEKQKGCLLVGRGGCSLFCRGVTEAMPLVSTPKHHRHPLDLDRGGLPNPLVHQLLQHLARKPSYAERAEKAPSLQKPENTRNEMPSPGSRRNLRTKASNLAKKKSKV